MVLHVDKLFIKPTLFHELKKKKQSYLGPVCLPQIRIQIQNRDRLFWTDSTNPNLLGPNVILRYCQQVFPPLSSGL